MMSRCIVFAGEVEGQLQPKILLPKDEAIAYAKELEEVHKLVGVCDLGNKDSNGKAKTIYSNFVEITDD
jgi:hypothetical protein